MKHAALLDTPCGPLCIEADAHAIIRISFSDRLPADAETLPSPLTEQAIRELQEYFAGTRRAFTFPTAVAGTPFQQAVWQELQEIPYGETRTYGQIADRIGRPKAVRAVGMANHRNPLCIVVPCHRVVGAGGALTGYAGGLDKKEYLLALEKAGSWG